MLLLVHVRPEREPDLETPEKLQLSRRRYLIAPISTISAIAAPGWWRPPGVLRLSNQLHIRDSGVQETLPWGARQAQVDDLPDDVLVFLLGSRYCDTDRLATRPGRCSARSRRAGRGCRRSWIIPMSASTSAISMPAPTAPPRKAMTSARASAATSPIWRSPCAAA